jgi:acetylserotonin N-methyltransferase
MTTRALLPQPTTNDRPIWDLLMSVYQLPVVMAADELGVFECLAEQPMSAAVLAEKLSLSSRGTEALLTVLLAMGLLVKYEGQFCLSELSYNYLLSDSPYSYGPHLRALRELPITWRTIAEALRHERLTEYRQDELSVAGLAGLWESAEPGRELIRMVTAGMHSHSFPAAMGLAALQDFQGVERLLDVGGGSGGACIALGLRYPNMLFTVMDLAMVCDCAAGYIADYGLTERIGTQAVDMFREPWPGGHDAILLSEILHDWSGPQCQELLTRCFSALPPKGRLFIHEMLLADAKDGPLATACFSLAMLLVTRGKQRTAAELRELLQAAGFVDMTFRASYGYFSLITARKP